MMNATSCKEVVVDANGSTKPVREPKALTKESVGPLGSSQRTTLRAYLTLQIDARKKRCYPMSTHTVSMYR